MYRCRLRVGVLPVECKEKIEVCQKSCVGSRKKFTELIMDSGSIRKEVKTEPRFGDPDTGSLHTWESELTFKELDAQLEDSRRMLLIEVSSYGSEEHSDSASRITSVNTKSP